MYCGKVSALSRAAFNKAKHLKQSDVIVVSNANGKRYIRLDLLMAKTMAPGEIQSVFLTVWGNLHPIAALINLAIVVSITASDFLFL